LNRNKIVLINSLFPVLSETFLFDQFKRLLQQSDQFEIVSSNVTPEEQIHPHMLKIRSKVTYLSTASNSTILTAMLSMLFSHPLRLFSCVFSSFFKKEERFKTSLAHIAGACLIKKQYPKMAWAHAHFTYGAAGIAYWLSQLTNIPYSLTLHGADVNYDNPADLADKLQNASHIFSISKFNIDYMHQKFPKTRQIATSVIPLGVDLALEPPMQNAKEGSKSQHQTAFEVTAKATRDQSSVLNILNVGRLSEHKAQHILIEACHQLKCNGRKFHCHIIGEGPKKDALKTLIKKYDLENDVTLHGLMYHQDVLAFYQRADVFVMSSVTEGMPLVIMESMQRGVPVIAPSVSGIPEMIDDQNDGLLYQVGSVAQLVSKLEQCFAQPDLLKLIGLKGSKKVNDCFDLDANTHKFGQALIELASKSPYDA
jgi:colanic acid/amylovoran biosynthesis glycosyltransferase